MPRSFYASLRKGRDSNPRRDFSLNNLAGCCFRPLSHPSLKKIQICRAIIFLNDLALFAYFIYFLAEYRLKIKLKQDKIMKTKLLTKNNYLNAIKKSVGSKIFQDVFLEKDGKEINITKGGRLSCAFFVSSILMLFHLLDVKKGPHSTIGGVLKNIQKSGWKEFKKGEMKEGDVLVWEKIKDIDGKEHEHIGFYIGNNMAVSNSTKYKSPKKHHFTYKDNRKIISFWRFNFV